MVEVNDDTGGWLKTANFDGTLNIMSGVKHNNRKGREMKQFVEGPGGWSPGPYGRNHSLCSGGIEQIPSVVAVYASRWEIISAKGRLGLQLEI